MAKSALDRAIEAVAVACAATTTFVKIPSFDPFEISPDNLLTLSFKEVGIISDAQMSAFRQALIRLLPNALLADLEKMPLAADIKVGLVVNHVEALLLQLAAGSSA